MSQLGYVVFECWCTIQPGSRGLAVSFLGQDNKSNYGAKGGVCSSFVFILSFLAHSSQRGMVTWLGCLLLHLETQLVYHYECS